MNNWAVSYVILLALWAAGNIAFDRWQAYQDTEIVKSIHLGDIQVQYTTMRRYANIADIRIVMLRGEPRLQVGSKPSSEKYPFTVSNIEVSNKFGATR